MPADVAAIVDSSEQDALRVRELWQLARHLEVQNGTGEDAVLLLHDPAADETVRGVYVQAMHSVRIEGIPLGTYELAFAEGLDWDSGRAAFRCGDREYAQFERDFEFTEKRDPNGIRYKAIAVTLHPVIGGNVRTKKISRQEFLKGFQGSVFILR